LREKREIDCVEVGRTVLGDFSCLGFGKGVAVETEAEQIVLKVSVIVVAADLQPVAFLTVHHQAEVHLGIGAALCEHRLNQWQMAGKRCLPGDAERDERVPHEFELQVTGSA